MSEQRAAERFNRAADGYDEANADWPPQRLLERMIALADLRPSDTVLDVGTGTGRLAILLAPRVRRVVGIDVSDEMLRRAREKANTIGVNNVEFLHGSFSQPGLSETFDGVVSSLAFEWVPDHHKRVALDNIAALLTVSGKLVVGERMLFVDPQVEPDRARHALSDIIRQATGRSLDEFNSTIPPTLLDRHLEAARRFSAEHQELHLRPANLVGLFRERGFDEVKVEEVSPLLGIISGRRRRQ